jgi:hypothetical protein
MDISLASNRVLGAIAITGSVLGLAMMVPLLMQGSLFRVMDQLALLSVVMLYGYGIWSGIEAVRGRPGWRTHARYFWVAQVPSISSSLVTFAVSCGAGAWLYIRAGSGGIGAGGAAYIGSAYQWSYMQHKPELLVGVNVLALAIVGWIFFLDRSDKLPADVNAV